MKSPHLENFWSRGWGLPPLLRLLLACLLWLAPERPAAAAAAEATPLIILQPQDLAAQIGANVEFVVLATSTSAGTLKYTWSGPGGRSHVGRVFTLSSITESDFGEYSVVVETPEGSPLYSTKSRTARLSLPAAPQIVREPLAQTVYPGISATFRVTATGAPLPSYQWRKGGGAIPGATGAEFSIPSVQTLDAGTYDVVVTNTEGRVISAAASLSLVPVSPPVVGVWSTYAGAPGGVGAVNGNGADARFAYLQGVAVDSAGTLYVADTANHAIRRITAAGEVTTLAGSLGTSGFVNGTGGAARFTSPQGIAVIAGTVYVSDTGTHTLRRITPAGVVTTFAGSMLIPGSNDGTGTGAKFNKPMRLAADASGNLLVADSLNHCIRTVTPEGVVTTLTGGAPYVGSADGVLSTARFNRPSDIALDGAGNAFVLDAGNKTVRKIGTDGTVTLLAGSPGYSGTADGTGSAARFDLPVALAADAAGTVYVADRNRLRKISAAGVVSTLAGSATAGFADATGPAAQFATPQGLAVLAGTLFVGDTGNSMLRRVELSSGAVGTLAGASPSGSLDGPSAAARFRSPRGIAADAFGNVYIADSGSHVIRKIDKLGAVSTVAGSPGEDAFLDGPGTAARFNSPYSLLVDRAGNLLVADTGNHAIRKITPEGEVTTLAGLGGTPGSLDGTGANARFWAPRSIACDPLGNVYVADTKNFTIRKILPSGLVTTLAGSPGNASNLDGIGSAARFESPTALVVDASGVVSVADGPTLRKITAAGVVSTFAGASGYPGSSNGEGVSAFFSAPQALAQDAAGNLYVADTFNHTIRKVAPSGAVTTLAGGAGKPGSADGTAGEVRFAFPAGLSLDSTGNLFVADTDNSRIRLGESGNRRILVPLPPLSTTAVLGGTATFSVLATGPGPLNYQWRKAGVNIPGATASTYTTPVLQASDADFYDVIVGNASGALASSPAVLAVSPSPLEPVTFSTQPAGLTSAFGNTALFTVKVAGTEPFTYQWRKDGVVLLGETRASLVLSAVGTLDAGSYEVVVSNPVGSVVSAQAALTVAVGQLPASIVAGPTPQKAAPGASATFTVSAVGTLPLTYQWRKGNQDIPGATAASYTIDSVQSGDLGQYSVRVTAASGDPADSVAVPLAYDLAPPVGGSWSTLAGPLGGPGSVDALLATSAFNYPRGLARTTNGTLYVADTSNHTIRKITAAGEVSTFAGSPGLSGSVNGFGGDARFNSPQGVALDAAGTLYVADAGNHTIRRILADGEVSTFAGTPNKPDMLDGDALVARFNRPEALVVTASGTVYVADTGNNVIRRITSGGSVTTFAGNARFVGHVDASSGAAQFNKPTGLALDSAGNLYVADSGNKVVRKIDSEASVTTVAGVPGSAGTADGGAGVARFTNPVALISDASGNLLVLDANSVRSVSSAGLVQTFAGSTAAGVTDGLATAARFSTPLGIASDGLGGAYLADTGNSVIRRLEFSGAVTTFAGVTNPGAVDSELRGAVRFRAPRGLAQDALGNTYVADSANHAIRKVRNSGATTTLAGALGQPGSADGEPASARFNGPEGVAVDAAGNVFVADTGNHVIRRISPVGVVSTLAGSPGQVGRLDGQGAAARFQNPRGLAVDSAGNLYVADSGNFALRKISPAGEVTTLAGALGTSGSLDGLGAAARFTAPVAVALDAALTIFVADGSAIRSVSPTGNVTTLAGTAGLRGAADGTGPSALFASPQGVAVDAKGDLYVADTYNQTIRKISPAVGETTLAGTLAVTTLAGAPGVTGSAEGSGAAARFAYPSGLVVDPYGNLWVSELDGAKLRYGVLGETPLEILNDPSAATLLAGTYAAFSVVAKGIAPLVYAWRKDGVSIPGAVGPVLVLPSVQAADVGVYDVEVTDAWSAAASKAARLEVQTAEQLAITITAEPASATVFEGDAVGFRIGASSLLPLTYQWSKDGTPIAGATSEFLSWSSAALGDGGTYSVVARHVYASATSAGAALVVNVKPRVVVPLAIQTQPQSRTVTAGVYTALSVTASGPGTLSYTWRKSGVSISGANSPSLIFTSAQAGNAGLYEVVVSSSEGGSVTSNAVTLTVNSAGPSGVPVISSQPVSIAGSAGVSAVFTVLATGAAPLRYQWRKNGENIPNANYLNYKIRSVSAADVGRYDVVVSNLVGRVSSTVASLSLPPVSDFAPVIDEQPAAVTLYPGVAATFRVGVKASPEPTFQWRKNGKAIPGENSSTYTIPSPGAADVAGSVDVVVTNALGTVTSGSATLSFKALPTGVGTWYTLAGNPGGRALTDGTGPAARFVYPNGIAMDGTGNLYVSDGASDSGLDVRIRKITPGGVVTTVATITGNIDSSGPLVVAPNGDIFTLYRRSIYKISSDGFSVQFAGEPNLPGNTPGTGKAARFGMLAGITISPAGDLYVTDSENDRVWKVTSNAVATHFAGSSEGFADGTGMAAKFFRPQGIKSDSLGNLYVADRFNSRVRKITSDGVVTTLAGSNQNGEANGPLAQASFNDLRDIALDAAGNVFVVDQDMGRGSNLIRKIGADGVVSDHAGYKYERGSVDGPGADARFAGIAHIVSDASGTCYVTDRDNFTVRKITPSGLVSTLAGVGGVGTKDGAGTSARFDGPNGLAVDAAGNVYVADTGSGSSGSIRKVTPAGAVTTLTQGLVSPVVIALGADGTMYANSGRSIVQIGAAGGSRLIAGDSTAGGTVNAQGSSARFNNPTGLAFRPDGTLLVMDFINDLPNDNAGSSAIRKIDEDGLVSDFVGKVNAPVVMIRSGGGSSPTFVESHQMALDASGNLFVADTGQGAIRKVSAVGAVSTVATSPGGFTPFRFPRGVAVTGSGTLYVADSGNSRICRITPDGVLTQLPGSGGWYMNSVATDASGNVYVAEAGTSKIRVGVMKDGPLEIVTQPTGGTVTLGGGITLTAGASGTGPITYQWRKEGVAIVGATSEAYTRSSAQLTDSGKYDVVIANGSGAYTSSSVFLTVITGVVTPVTFTTQPVSVNVSPGGAVSLSVGAAGTAPLTYQWRKNGVEVEGATGTRFAIAAADFDAEGYYDVVVTNAGGSSLSEPAQLTVGSGRGPSAPLISSQPVSLTVASGFGAELNVAAQGTAPVRYQWRKDGVPIPNANYFSYKIVSASAANAGNYDVVLSNAQGTVTSAVAVLSVPPPADASPAIATQPLSAAVYPGVPATFRVGATGLPAPTFQWRKNGANIPGATAASYTIAFPTADDAAGYDVLVTNTLGTATSTPAALTFKALPAAGKGTWYTLAGSADREGNNDGIGIAASFNHPSGIAVDPDGNIYVGDEDSYTIRKITPTRAVTTFAGTAGASGSTDGFGQNARFGNIGGVAVDSEGNLFVSDSGNHTIRKITRGGEVTTFAGKAGFSGNADGLGSAARFSGPRGLAVDSMGNVYVADRLNHTIRKISRTGTVSTLAGAAGFADTADGLGSAARFHQPSGVAVDASGNVYVADTYNSTIRKVTAAGEVTTLAGLAGFENKTDGVGAAARFEWPEGVVVDGNGNVYVADTGERYRIKSPDYGNNLIRKITPARQVTTIGGMGSVSGSADGYLTEARFFGPRGIALDGNGHLLVTDAYNSTIRKGVQELTAPVVLVQPVPRESLQGMPAAFSVSVKDSTLMSYQWRKDGVAIAGGTQATYSIDSVQPSDQGVYDVILANALGAVTSASAALSLSSQGVLPVTISSQPGGVLANLASALDLSVTASGTAPLTYQWRKDGVEIPAATKPVYTIASLSLSSSGYYDVVVTNPAGSVLSEPALVALNSSGIALPSIVTQPVGAEGVLGGFATLKVVAAGGGPLRYQWRKGGAPVPGATSAAYTINGLREADAGTYDVQVSNGSGLVTSNAVLLTVSNPLAIVTQPAPLTVAVGNYAFFSVVAGGSGPLTYQWRRDGQPLAAGTRSFYVVPSVQVGDAGGYDVVVSNAAGSLTSDPAALTLQAGSGGAQVSLLAQPLNTAVQAGGAALFSVTASGTGPITYRWYREGVEIPGATEPVYRIAAVQTRDVGRYSVRVANSASVVNSTKASLTLITPVKIVSPPQPTLVAAGTAAVFSVTATGTAPLTYQWRKNGQNIVGATLATYRLEAVAAADGGSYDVVVANQAGAAVSEPAVLGVGAKPVLVTGPVGGTLLAGGTLVLSVSAAGEGLTYQWRKNGLRMPGQTSATLTLRNAAASDAGRFEVVVANPYGVLSPAPSAEVVVHVPVRFSRQPLGSLIGEGESLTLSVQATGSTPLAYQWRRDGVPIPGATQFRYTVGSASAANAGAYDVVVTNPAGALASNVVQVSVSEPLVIVRQPQGASVTQGSAVTLSVRAKGSGDIKYAWYKWSAAGIPLVVGTLSTLDFPSTSAGDAGTYSVLVTGNGTPAFSDRVALSVSTLPGIVVLEQPVEEPLLEGVLPTVRVLIDGASAAEQQTRYTLCALQKGAPVATGVSGVVPETGILDVPVARVVTSGAYVVRFNRIYTGGKEAQALTQPFYLTVPAKPDLAGTYQGLLLEPAGDSASAGGQRGWLSLTVSSKGSFSGRVQYVQDGSLAGAPSQALRLYQPVSRSFSGVLRSSAENAFKLVAAFPLGVGSQPDKELLELEMDQSSAAPLLTAKLTDRVSRPDSAGTVSAATGLKPSLGATGALPAAYAAVAGRYALSAPEAGSAAADNNAQILVQVLPSGRVVWATRLTGYSGSGSSGLSAPLPAVLSAPLYEGRSTPLAALLTNSTVSGELRWTQAADGGWDLALSADRLEQARSKVAGNRVPGGFAAAYAPAAFAAGTNYSGLRALDFGGAQDCRINGTLLATLFAAGAPGLTFVSADPLAGGSLGFRWNVTVSSTGLVRTTGIAAGGVPPPVLSLRLDKTRGEWAGSYVTGGVRRSLIGCVLDVPESRGQGWFETGTAAGRWELQLGQ